MAYTIRNTKNEVVTTVADASVDSTLDIRLIGKNYVGYGTALNENLVAMLENFANVSAPTKAIQGQVWFDTSALALKVYDGTSFGYIANKATNLTATSANISGSANVTGNVYAGNLVATTFFGNVSGNITGNLSGNVTGNVTGNVSATSLTGTLGTAAQPNITSLGNLTTLTVSGNTWLATTGGSVAIGTNTPDSGIELDIRGTGASSTVQVTGTGMAVGRLEAGTNGNVTLTNQSEGSLKFAANNNVFMTILPSGNVGIGNVNPANTFRVVGNASISTTLSVGTTASVTNTATVGNLSTAGNIDFTGTSNRIRGDFSNATVASRVAFQSSTTNGITSIQAIPNGTGTNASFGAFNNSDPTNAAYVSINAIGSSAVRIQSGITGTGTYLPMTFYTGGLETVRIDTNGNVGIGASSPWAGITVVKDNGYGYIAGFRKDSSSDWLGIASYGTLPSIQGVSANLATTADMAMQPNSGNVGIGGTPARKLDVYGGSRFLQDTAATTGAIVLRQNSGDTVGAYIQWVNNSNSAEKGWLTVDTSSNMLFATGSTERMRVDSSGNVAIGTSTTTGGRLTVSGNAQVTSLGVGTAASGVTGEIRATNNIVGYYSSDKRLKENVVPISDAVAKINSMSGVMFDWTDEHIQRSGGEDDMFMRKHDVGVIAQEVAEVLPEVVATRDDGYMAVRYEKLVPLLIQAVKELSAEIERLKGNV